MAKTGGELRNFQICATSYHQRALPMRRARAGPRQTMRGGAALGAQTAQGSGSSGSWGALGRVRAVRAGPWNPDGAMARMPGRV